MSVTLTAVANSAKTAFDLQLVSTGGYTTFTILRMINGGSQIVRGASSAALSSGAAFLRDFEAPQNTSVQYVAQVSGSAGTESSPLVTATGQIDFKSDVIFDLTRPSSPVPVFVESLPELSSDLGREVVWVAGRADPVVIMDVRRSPSGQLNLLADSLAQRDAISAAVAGGNIVCFSPRFPSVSGFTGVTYYSVGQMREQRLVAAADEPGRRMVLDIQQVAPPPSSFVPIDATTWQQVVDSGLSWAQANAAKTWQSLAYG
ncbi:MAG: hypothetical protein ACKOAF_05475 [Actinomycetes bacterium]